MTFTRIFVLERKFAYSREAQAVFWGSPASKCALVAPGLLLYSGAQSLLE